MQFCGQMVDLSCEVSFLPNEDNVVEISPITNSATATVYIKCPDNLLSIFDFHHFVYRQNNKNMIQVFFNVGSSTNDGLQRLPYTSVKVKLEVSNRWYDVTNDENLSSNDIQGNFFVLIEY